MLTGHDFRLNLEPGGAPCDCLVIFQVVKGFRVTFVALAKTGTIKLNVMDGAAQPAWTCLRAPLSSSGSTENERYYRAGSL